MTVRITFNSINTTRIADMEKAGEQRLPAAVIERLAGVRSGDAIVCAQGILWVTQEGDPQDYMLRNGEQFIANRHGVVVVQAMTDATVRYSRN